MNFPTEPQNEYPNLKISTFYLNFVNIFLNFAFDIFSANYNVKLYIDVNFF